MDENEDITRKATMNTLQLLRAWSGAQKRLERARNDLNSAETDLLNATNSLGKWMVPPDSKSGEEFHLWVADGILCASQLLTPNGDKRNDYRVGWRTPLSPKTKCEMQL